jgi:hypothetical protein
MAVKRIAAKTDVLHHHLSRTGKFSARVSPILEDSWGDLNGYSLLNRAAL